MASTRHKCEGSAWLVNHATGLQTGMQRSITYCFLGDPGLLGHPVAQMSSVFRGATITLESSAAECYLPGTQRSGIIVRFDLLVGVMLSKPLECQVQGGRSSTASVRKYDRRGAKEKRQSFHVAGRVERYEGGGQVLVRYYWDELL